MRADRITSSSVESVVDIIPPAAQGQSISVHKPFHGDQHVSLASMVWRKTRMGEDKTREKLSRHRCASKSRVESLGPTNRSTHLRASSSFIAGVHSALRLGPTRETNPLISRHTRSVSRNIRRRRRSRRRSPHMYVGCWMTTWKRGELSGRRRPRWRRRHLFHRTWSASYRNTE